MLEHIERRISRALQPVQGTVGQPKQCPVLPTSPSPCGSLGVSTGQRRVRKNVSHIADVQVRGFERSEVATTVELAPVDTDFEVDQPPELIGVLRLLAGRLANAVSSIEQSSHPRTTQ
jgi:hypothetical protein